MNKAIWRFVVTIIIIMFGMTGIAEARRGETSSSSSSKSSSSSRSSSSSSSSKSSYSSSSSKSSYSPSSAKSSYSSSPSKSNSSFANAAKTKQAKTSWQDYIQKHEVSTPALPQQKTALPQRNDTSNLEKQAADLQSQIRSEKKRKKADNLTKQLAAIEKQIADSRRQQQLIAVAQTAAQVALNRQRQPSSPQTMLAPVTNSTAVNTAKPAQSKSSGGSWIPILLILAMVVMVILWRRRSNSSPTTLYRL